MPDLALQLDEDERLMLAAFAKANGLSEEEAMSQLISVGITKKKELITPTTSILEGLKKGFNDNFNQ